MQAMISFVEVFMDMAGPHKDLVKRYPERYMSRLGKNVLEIIRLDLVEALQPHDTFGRPIPSTRFIGWGLPKDEAARRAKNARFCLEGVEKVERHFPALLNSSSAPEEAPPKKKKAEPIEIDTPPGATWEQITLRVTGEGNLQFRCGADLTAPYSFEDLGLVSKKKLSEVFRDFLAHDGELPRTYEPFPEKASIYNLNKHLKKLFPNVKDGNPIKTYSVNGYRCRFRIEKPTK